MVAIIELIDFGQEFFEKIEFFFWLVKKGNLAKKSFARFLRPFISHDKTGMCTSFLLE